MTKNQWVRITMFDTGNQTMNNFRFNGFHDIWKKILFNWFVCIPAHLFSYSFNSIYQHELQNICVQNTKFHGLLGWMWSVYYSFSRIFNNIYAQRIQSIISFYLNPKTKPKTKCNNHNNQFNRLCIRIIARPPIPDFHSCILRILNLHGHFHWNSWNLLTNGLIYSNISSAYDHKINQAKNHQLSFGHSTRSSLHFSHTN